MNIDVLIAFVVGIFLGVFLGMILIALMIASSNYHQYEDINNMSEEDLQWYKENIWKNK